VQRFPVFGPLGPFIDEVWGIQVTIENMVSTLRRYANEFVRIWIFKNMAVWNDLWVICG
jgi:hypothetical protein